MAGDAAKTPFHLYLDETQYFGFYPLSLMDDFSVSSYDIIYSIADKFITMILASSECTNIPQQAIEEVLACLYF